MSSAPTSNRLPADQPAFTTLRSEVPKPRSRPYLVELSRPSGASRFSFTSLPHEDEDSRITGGTRSLIRRLLALNVEGSLPKREAVGVAGARPLTDAKSA